LLGQCGVDERARNTKAKPKNVNLENGRRKVRN
jgi:hypothetical protein